MSVVVAVLAFLVQSPPEQVLPIVRPGEPIPNAPRPSYFGGCVSVLTRPDHPEATRILASDSNHDCAWILALDGSVIARIPESGSGIGFVDLAGDADGDGKPDWFVGKAGARTVVSSETMKVLATFRCDELRWLGDVDGDGAPEVVTADAFRGRNPPENLLRVEVRSLHDEAPRWSWQGRISYHHEPRHVVRSDDVDGDGRPDVLVLAEEQVQVLSGRDGHAILAMGEKGALPARRVVCAGDLDGDGHVDFVVGYPDASCSERRAAHVDVLSGKDGARLRRLTDDGGMFGEELAAGSDVDGDGTPDFAVTTHSGPWEGVRVYSGKTGQVLRSFRSDWDCHRRFSVAFVPATAAGEVADIVIGATTWYESLCDDGSVTLWSGKTGEQLQLWTARTPAIVAIEERAKPAK